MKENTPELLEAFKKFTKQIRELTDTAEKINNLLEISWNPEINKENLEIIEKRQIALEKYPNLKELVKIDEKGITVSTSKWDLKFALKQWEITREHTGNEDFRRDQMIALWSIFWEKAWPYIDILWLELDKIYWLATSCPSAQHAAYRFVITSDWNVSIDSNNKIGEFYSLISQK